MKSISKKLLLLLCAVLCVAALAGCGKSEGESSSASGLDATTEDWLKTAVEDMLVTVSGLSDDEMDYYVAMNDESTNALIEPWIAVKGDLGAYAGAASHSVSESHGSYVIVSKVDYADNTATVTTTLSGDLNTIESMIYNVDYPMSHTIQRAALNTLMGMGTVFIVLIFLCFLISLFKYIPGLVDKAAGKQEPIQASVPEPAAVPAPAPVEEEEDLSDDLELVAVISAAIAAAEQTSVEGFRVRSIKRVSRGRR